jgi:hypothetical protein
MTRAADQFPNFAVTPATGPWNSAAAGVDRAEIAGVVDRGCHAADPQHAIAGMKTRFWTGSRGEEERRRRPARELSGQEPVVGCHAVEEEIFPAEPPLPAKWSVPAPVRTSQEESRPRESPASADADCAS